MPTLIDPSDLDAVTAPFGRSKTLPRVAYRSDDVLSLEVDRLFTHGWVCAGRVDSLVGPGQARAVMVGTEPVLLTCDEAGNLRGFSNVCRHRAHELLPVGQTVDMRLIKCPYHAWTYGLDGNLRGAPTLTRSEDFDKTDYPLVQVACEVWEGFLFVDASGSASPLAEVVGNLADVLAPYDIGSLRRGARHEYEIAANWKLVVENYHECYHCSSIHPALCEVSPPDSGEDVQPTGLWCGGTMVLEDHAVTMSFDGSSGGVTLPALDAEQRRQVLYVGLMPNLLVSAHPDYVMTHRLVPLAPDRTWIECEWLFPEDALSAEGFDPAYAVDFWDVTNREDWAACEGVQRGIGSQGYRQGPLSPWESTLYQFYQMIAAVYRGEPVTPPVMPVSTRL